MNTLWSRLETLIAPKLDASPDHLAAHGVHLLAARALRALDRPVPRQLQDMERTMALRELALPSLLTRIRATVSGPIILLKGPEVAARYPDPALRAYGDLDILVPEPLAAQHALLAAGFQLVDDYAFPHHLQPVFWPGLPIPIEIHHTPSWLRWMTPPTNAELFDLAIPSATGLPGLLTLPPVEHTLLLAAHSWRHAPLRRLIDLVDIATMAEGLDAGQLDPKAGRWGLGPVWNTTRRAIEALVGPDPSTSWPLHLWARHLRAMRDRTVAEQHAAVWLGTLWAPTPRAKLHALAATVAGDLRPLGGEPWPVKVQRTSRAIRDAASPWTPRDRRGQHQEHG